MGSDHDLPAELTPASAPLENTQTILHELVLGGQGRFSRIFEKVRGMDEAERASAGALVARQLRNVHELQLDSSQIAVISRDEFGSHPLLLKERTRGAIDQLWRKTSGERFPDYLGHLDRLEEGVRSSKGIRYLRRDYFEAVEALIRGTRRAQHLPGPEFLPRLLSGFAPPNTRRGRTDEVHGFFEILRCTAQSLTAHDPAQLHTLEEAVLAGASHRSIWRTVVQPMLEVPPSIACRTVARECNLSGEQYVNLVDNVARANRGTQRLAADVGAALRDLPRDALWGERPREVLRDATRAWLEGGFESYRFALRWTEEEAVEQKLGMDPVEFRLNWGRDARWRARVGEELMEFHSTSRFEDLFYAGDRPKVTCTSLTTLSSLRSCGVATVADPWRRVVQVWNSRGELAARATCVLTGAGPSQAPQPAILVDVVYGTAAGAELPGVVGGGMRAAYCLPAFCHGQGHEAATGIVVLPSRAGTHYLEQSRLHIGQGVTIAEHHSLPLVAAPELQIADLQWLERPGCNWLENIPARCQEDAWLEEVFPDRAEEMRERALLPSGPLPSANREHWRAALRAHPEALPWLHKVRSLETRMGGAPRPGLEGEDLRAAVTVVSNWSHLATLVQGIPERERRAVHEAWVAGVEEQVRAQPGVWPAEVDREGLEEGVRLALEKAAPASVAPHHEQAPPLAGVLPRGIEPEWRQAPLPRT